MAPDPATSGVRTGGQFKLLAHFLGLLLPLFAIAVGAGLYIVRDISFGDERAVVAARIGNLTARGASALNKLPAEGFASRAEPILSVLLADPAVACTVVLNKDGQVIAAAPPVIGCKGTNFETRLELPLDAVPGGVLCVKYNLAEIEQRTTKLQNFFEVVLLLGLVMATVASWIAFRRVVGRPVNALLQAIGKSQGGAVPALVEVIPNNELGTVITEFNKMQSLLNEERQRIALAQGELHKQARTDFLTGLPNRQGLEEYLNHKASQNIGKQDRAALLFLDLDHFKSVNDSMGHEAGDRLLQQVSERLTKNISRRDFVARLGGDEFAVVLNDLRSETEALPVAERILEAVRAPYDLIGSTAVIGASIGVVRLKQEQDVEDSLRQADSAMYRSKRAGRNRVTMQGPRMSAQTEKGKADVIV